MAKKYIILDTETTGLEVLQGHTSNLKTIIMNEYSQDAKGSMMTLMTLFTKHQTSILMGSLQEFEVR